MMGDTRCGMGVGPSLGRLSGLEGTYARLLIYNRILDTTLKCATVHDIRSFI
jgi:hypothetical protein